MNIIDLLTKPIHMMSSGELLLTLPLSVFIFVVAVLIGAKVIDRITSGWRDSEPEAEPTYIDYDTMLPHERERHKQYAWTKHYGGYELSDNEKLLLRLDDQPDDKGDLTVIQRRLNGLSDDEPIGYEAMDSFSQKIHRALAKAKLEGGYELTEDEKRLPGLEDQADE